MADAIPSGHSESKTVGIVGRFRRASKADLRLEGYLGTIAGYRKNRHDELAEGLRRRIADEWGRRFDEWRYAR
jgi:hypothetical protein